MSKIELHTSVEEVLECEDVQGFLIKKVNLGKNDFWIPFRVIYLSTDIPPYLRNKILEIKKRSTLFEVNRVIYKDRSFNALNSAIQECDDERIKKILKINEKLSRENILISLSFSDFPTLKVGRRNFEELLDYVHAFSSILFVPHVRFGDGKTKVKYSGRDFCKYVDDVVNILKERNTKPLFVPFDMSYDMRTRDEILTCYANKGYTNIWIDFQGRVFSNTLIAKMRTLIRRVNNLFGENANDIVIYLANIKKTPRGTQKDFKIAPSDFLGAFSYGDIVGSPWKGIIVPYQQSEEDEAYWERKGYRSEENYKVAMFKRDCSIFEVSSYYYRHPDKIQIKNRQLDEVRKTILQLLQLGLSGEYRAEKRKFEKIKRIAEGVSYAVSGFVMSNELNQLRKKVEREGRLLDYIGNKEFFREEGLSILERLRTPEKTKVKRRKEKGIFDFIVSSS